MLNKDSLYKILDNRYLLYLCMLLIICFNKTSVGQIFPSQNARLNYTQVMFEFPEVKSASDYFVQVAENSVDSNFIKSIIIQKHDSSNATLISGLNFGRYYQWRYVAFNKDGNIIHVSKLFSFKILKNNLVDENFYRYKINKKEVDDGLIFLDNSLVAIDRNGTPVWFLPNKILNGAIDIKMTKAGTITLLSNRYKLGFEDGLEVSLTGDTLWKTPHDIHIFGDTLEYFHHNFTRLNTGNYMVMGNKFVKPKKDIKADLIGYGTLIEFDPAHNVVWSWDSEKNNTFSDTDVYFPPNLCSYFYINYFTRKIYDPFHSNGFYYDEKNDIIYFSIRLLSRVSKIEKHTGKILAEYGEKFPSGKADHANGFFNYQHAPVLLPGNKLLVFSNNNFEGIDRKNLKISKAVIFSQPEKNNKESEIAWEFSCKVDSLSNGCSIRTGNVAVLDNGNYIINTGGPEGRIFEVTRDKKIVWDCSPELYSKNNESWLPSSNFKVSFSKSLYPVYFTVNNSFNPDTFSFKKKTHFEFKINNKGTDPDCYLIIYKVNGQLYKKFVTCAILPGKSEIIEANFKKSKAANEQISIIISSLANPQFKRELYFYRK
jgi:hypothetical protein